MPDAPDIDDAELVQRIMRGDEAAFTTAYWRCGPSVHRFVLHMTGDEYLAQEITQEVFMKLITNSRAYDPARGTLCGWLLGIARNVVRRTNAPERQLEALDEAVLRDSICGHLDNLTRREALETVRQVIAALP